LTSLASCRTHLLLLLLLLLLLVLVLVLVLVLRQRLRDQAVPPSPAVRARKQTVAHDVKGVLGTTVHAQSDGRSMCGQQKAG
jgi:hypothetical protein